LPNRAIGLPSDRSVWSLVLHAIGMLAEQLREVKTGAVQFPAVMLQLCGFSRGPMICSTG